MPIVCIQIPKIAQHVLITNHGKISIKFTIKFYMMILESVAETTRDKSCSIMCATGVQLCMVHLE